MDSRDKLLNGINGIAPGQPVLVLNSAPCQCKADGDFFGDGVSILAIDLEDDPDERKKFDQGKAVTSACGDQAVEGKKRCAGDAKQHFHKVSAAIESCLDGNGKVMVHCHASISRSVVFIAAHVMRTQRRTALDVLREMKQKWDATWPCDRFVMQLVEYEKELAQAEANAGAWFTPMAVGLGIGALLATAWSRWSRK